MAIVSVEHKCKLTDLVTTPVPIEDPSGECVAFPVTCRVCGKKFEEVYSRNEGLWDPDIEEYVTLKP